MTGALIILAVTTAIGVLLWAWEKFRTQRHGHSLHHHAERQEGQRARSQETSEHSDSSDLPTTQKPTNTTTSICCGLHAICEKTGRINEPAVYYDDEELDRFAGRSADGYTDEETEEFRDVLLTLLPADAPGWTVSLEKRRINLPSDLRPELELLLSES
ncbi:MAG: phospholipase [Muribaculaceae bacterium]|nr:phospholipase [Muribaculaceae bacterium]